MEKLNRYLAFLSLVAASVLLLGLYASYRQVKKTRAGLADSLTIAAFLSPGAGSEEIEETRKYIEDSDNIYIKNFLSSRDIYKSMSESSSIAEHIKIIGEDFIFPPTYEIGMKNLYLKKIDRDVGRLREFENIEYVDYNKDAARRAYNFSYKIKMIYRFLAFAAGLLGFFLFLLSGFFCYLNEKDEYRFLKLYRGNLSRRLNAGILSAIFSGFLAAIAAAGASYLLINNIEAMEFFSFKEFAVLAAAISLIAGGSYAFIIRITLLSKNR
ncbi:MAG: hypothetical protein U9R36_05930 [Elusimicrobiota bacterium]|nr:hypothetical protein [Elusimicrobiota bacterium]